MTPPLTTTPIAARDASFVPSEKFDQPPTVLLVGELNPYGADPDMALYHLPHGASGDRLRRVLDLRPQTYLGLWRANLCAGTWQPALARERAHRLLFGPYHLSEESPLWRPWDTVVMLGRKVARAFAGALHRHEAVQPLTTGSVSVEGLPVTLVSLPHPSGLSRAWNTPDCAARVVALLREHAPGVAWGEGAGS